MEEGMVGFWIHMLGMLRVDWQLCPWRGCLAMRFLFCLIVGGPSVMLSGGCVFGGGGGGVD